MITIKKVKINKSILNQVQELKNHKDYVDIALCKSTYIKSAEALGYVNLKDERIVLLSVKNNSVDILRKVIVKEDVNRENVKELLGIKDDLNSYAYHLIRNGLREQIYV